MLDNRFIVRFNHRNIKHILTANVISGGHFIRLAVIDTGHIYVFYSTMHACSYRNGTDVQFCSLSPSVCDTSVDIQSRVA